MRRPVAAAVDAICSSASERPWTWFLGTLALTLPALWSAGHLALDTDLIRLLPRHTRAAQATEQLDEVVGGTSYFALILEGDEPDRLRAAAQELAARAAEIEGVGEVEHIHPVDFIERYRYLLIPSYYLEVIQDRILDWEAEVSPFVDDLGDVREDEEPDFAEQEDRKEIEDRLERYGNLPRYHQSADGRLMGIFVRPARGVTSLGATRRLFERLQELAGETADRHGVWAGVSGSMRNKVDEYDLIVADLGRSGLVASALILLTLLVSFRSVSMGLLPLYPLLAGLVWGFALVPWTVGDLNTITAFLLLVVFGMGIDYSIHLLQRYRLELLERPPAQALREAYATTGKAVAASALTTALALAVLAVSDFRGFSEFGIVGGLSVIAVLAAMYLVFPATLVLATRAGLVRPGATRVSSRLVPGHALAVVLVLATVAAGVAAAAALSFDYDFSNLQATNDLPEAVEVKDKQRQVYTTTRSPAATYVAADLATLDRALAVLEEARRRPGSRIGRVASIRDLVPEPGDAERRRELIAQIQDDLRGSWTRRVEDPQHRRWIEDLQRWQPPDSTPSVEEIPDSLRAGLFARDGTDRPLLAVYPAVERKDGRNAMAFTAELYELQIPAGVAGPIGETPVFAEILWLVLGQGPWMVAAAFLGVFLVVLLYQRSLVQTLWILLPLSAGMALTLGTMTVLGIELTFFNVVVLPALLGLGVDDGVHYYRRWRELGGDSTATSSEMFVPLTVTSLTTMMGYSGMLLAGHQGLHSIGLVACLGLALIWATSLLMAPGLLDRLHPALAGAGARPETAGGRP